MTKEEAMREWDETLERRRDMSNPILTPLGRRVLLTLLPEPPKSTIILDPGLTPEGLTRRGTVLAVGEKCQYVAVGDTVIVRISTGKTVGDQMVIEEQAILATIPEGA